MPHLRFLAGRIIKLMSHYSHLRVLLCKRKMTLIIVLSIAGRADYEVKCITC